MSTALKQSQEIIPTGASVAATLELPETPRSLVDKDREVVLRQVEVATNLIDLDDPCGSTIGETGSISQRLFDKVALMDEAPKRAYLERIYGKVAAPLHLKAVLPALKAELERRRLAGVPWVELTENLDITVPLTGFAVTVVDANGYTACLLEGDYGEKLATAVAIMGAFNRIAQDTGATLLEPVVGDAAVFLTNSAEQQSALERALAELKIPMQVEVLKNKTREDGALIYPVDGIAADGTAAQAHFTLSVGISKSGVVTVRAFTGKKGNCGAVFAEGAAIDAALDSQKRAGPGQILKAESSGEDVGEGMEGGELVSISTRHLSSPQSNIITMKLIEALLKMSNCFDTDINALLEETNTEALTPRLEAYYAVLNLEGGDAREFWKAFMNEGIGMEHIGLFKPVGARELHFWSKGITSPQQFKAAFETFVRQISQIAKRAGCSVKLGLGYESALELLRLPNSVQVDATGAVIVGTVRAVAALHGKEENLVNVDRSACEALGFRGVEMTTRYIKGKPYQGVHLLIGGNGELSIPEPLVGREKELTTLHGFVDNLGQNGVVLQVKKPDDATEGGYGESALLRATERYAREKGFDDSHVVHLGSGTTLFVELESKLGLTVDYLLSHPEEITSPVLLLWDADCVSPAEAAQMDRFLFAMAGAPIGLVYCGAYQFRPGVMAGDNYRGRELSAHLTLAPLNEEEACELVLQTRTDLNDTFRERIKQLLQEWGKPYTPRLLIHNFAAALWQSGLQLSLKQGIVDQIWAGELASVLAEAGLTEMERTALGVIAEVGLPVSEAQLNWLFSSLTWSPILSKLLERGLIQLAEEGGSEASYRLAGGHLRRARLLVRSHAMVLRRGLVESDFFRAEGGGAEISQENEPYLMIELEHALSHAEACRNPKTLALVERLGRFYLSDRKNFEAAYTLYRRFWEAFISYGGEAARLSTKLVHDLVWVFTQTGNEEDAACAHVLLEASSDALSPELFWRKHMHVHGSSEAETQVKENMRNVMGQLNAISAQLTGTSKELYQKIRQALELEASFAAAAAESAKTLTNAPALLSLAFSAAELSRTACSARLMARLAGQLESQGEAYEGIASSLRRRAVVLVNNAQADCSILEAEFSSGDSLEESTSTELEGELRAEILRCFMDTHKYLSPHPNDVEMDELSSLHKKVGQAFGILARPTQSASLDAFDVYSNALALYWQRKLPLPDVFEGEGEAEAEALIAIQVTDREAAWSALETHQGAIQVKLVQAVRGALLPLRHRLTLQLMNFIHLKLRLLVRTGTFSIDSSDLQLFDRLCKEYENLARDSARLYRVLEGGTQDDYYRSECQPIVDYVNTRLPVSELSLDSVETLDE